MITGRSEAEIRTYNRNAKEVGVDEFLGKPLTPEMVRRLAAKVKTARGGSQS